MNPVGTRHCGLCSKCRERHDAFLEADAADPTVYVDERHVRA
jgi:7-cyano-7-deazaguanine synthase in queuosine biosynthesis